MSIKDHLAEIGISSNEYLELLSLYSYLGREEQWISYNYKYGLEKLKDGDYSIACTIFDRLVKHFSEFEGNDNLFIAECYYNKQG